jgi:hypothetical protein
MQWLFDPKVESLRRWENEGPGVIHRTFPVPGPLLEQPRTGSIFECDNLLQFIDNDNGQKYAIHPKFGYYKRRQGRPERAALCAPGDK